jgi:Tol biopolymer transport system component
MRNTPQVVALPKVAATAAVAGACLALGAGAASPAAQRNGRIAFQRFDPALGTTRIYTVQADGRGLRAVTRPAPLMQADAQPDWSADGRRILFRRIDGIGRPDERVDIYVVGADGRGLRNLTRASCSGFCLTNEEPAWSPDGKRIAFVRTIGPAPAGRHARVVGIFVMNADGTHVRELTQRRGTSVTEDHAPSWSPDGKRIALVSVNVTAKPAGASVLYVIGANGASPRAVRSMPHGWPAAGAPSWSPDGKRILYGTYCWFGTCGQPATGAQLFSVGADGKSPRQLTHVSGNAIGGRWSPDGRKIVFVRNPRVGPTGEVYTMSSDGSALRRVTPGLDQDARGPDWGTSSQ